MIEQNYPNPNPGKNLKILIGESAYLRFPLKTHLITLNDNLSDIVARYAVPFLQKGDILCISERIVSIMQGRAIPISSIKPTQLAKFFSKFVTKTIHGIGIGSPWSMHLAIRELGYLRFFLAVFISLLTKPFGIKGGFYFIAGKSITGIDGPCHYTIPPYDKYVTLAPIKSKQLAKSLAEKIGYDIAIVDVSNFAVFSFGKSGKNISDKFLAQVLRDNPLGQETQQTPLCIIRKI